MLTRLRAVAGVSGGWTSLCRNTFSVLRQEGLRGFWRRVRRYFGQVSAPEPRCNAIDLPDPAPHEPVRAIAFFLPQYHPIPENDLWWGKGFTEWTNVSKAQPNFDGHYQPHLPTDLGFYDLRLEEVRQAQAELAKAYGVYGFCYYYYWFAGRRLLTRPMDEMLSSGKPDMPFCVCWANENWTRTWDGQASQILLAQQHSAEDDLAFIDSLIPALRDQRYIRIDGRPLLLVYRVNLLPDAQGTAERWRARCREIGIGELYLAAVDSFLDVPPTSLGFDGAVEFPPHGMGVPVSAPPRTRSGFRGLCYSYPATRDRYLAKSWPEHDWFRGVMPAWDNTARRQDTPHVFLDSSPDAYQLWLQTIADQTRQHHRGDKRLVFINAWNEWAEGNHLEPDRRYGHAWLAATAAALGSSVMEKKH